MNYELPAWAVTDEAKAFYYGFALISIVRITRACLKWFRAVSHERYD